MSVQFGIDASSFQGNVNWARADSTTSFGWEKVTQGSRKTASRGYVNPFWAGPSGHSKRALAARAAATGFVPGGYLFLEAGDGAGQADFFHAAAGDMAGFAIAVDVEPAAGSKPTAADAHACVARLRRLYPSHPVIGYIPHWYWGDQSTRFVDVLWASNYVTGTGPPARLYAKVTPGQWAAYGGRAPALLQFTNAATVPGVTGKVDCSAFRGTAAQLRAQLLPDDSQHATEDLMQPGFLLSGAGAVTPLAIPNGAKRLRFFSNRPAQVRVDLIGVSKPTSTVTLGYEHGAQGVATGGALAAVVHRVDAGDNEVSYVITGLQRRAGPTPTDPVTRSSTCGGPTAAVGVSPTERWLPARGGAGQGARHAGQLRGDGGALAGGGADLEPAAEGGEPVGHVPQPDPIGVWRVS
jgi:GH25 family lysozyme M1 (1,4-beta-N-acetylmuramidase)